MLEQFRVLINYRSFTFVRFLGQILWIQGKESNLTSR